MIEIILAIIVIVFTTIGQILLKIGTNHKKSIFLNLYVFIAYVLFTITIFISYQLLKTLDILYFTIIISLNYVTVLLTSIFFLKEKITKRKIIGTTLVAIGIVIFIL